MGVANFVMIRLVRPGAPCESVCSFGFASGCALRVAGFVRLHLCRLGAPCVRSSSSGTSVCDLAAALFCRVPSRSSGSSVCALEVAGVCLVLLGTPWKSLGSLGFVLFVGVRFGGRWVRFRSSGRALVFLCVRLVRPGGRCFCFRSFCTFQCTLVVVGRVRPGGHLVRSGSSASFVSALGVARFVRVRLVC